MSTQKLGLGRSTLVQQPLMLVRQLGHPELIFNTNR